MQKELTTKQMELLILICAITEYAETNVDYTTAIDETIAGILDKDIASNENYGVLKEFGFIDDECFATIDGVQYIKLFNEYCETQKSKKKEEHRCFLSININQLHCSLFKIAENSMLGKLTKIFPMLDKAEN